MNSTGSVKSSGFTLTELVMILVIVGVLAAVAIPKLADRSVFESRGFTDQVRSALQYAQKTAIAQRRNVCADVTPSSLALTKAAASGAAVACTLAVANPTTSSAFTLSAPGGVTLSSTSANIVFDALGQSGSTVTVSVQGDVTRQIVVEQVTGYVR